MTSYTPLGHVRKPSALAMAPLTLTFGAMACAGVFLLLWSHWHELPLTPHPHPPRSDTMIISSDTRAPVVELDPELPLNHWTLSTLNNHLYARSLGVDYRMVVLETPSEIEPSVGDSRLQGICKHRTYGWRPHSFCKLPLVWDLLRTEAHLENVVFIDSDAVFRSPNISVYRHLDQLSLRRNIGFAVNQPWDNGPCAGYWFLSRGREVADAGVRERRTAEDFLVEWWNEDWRSTGYQPTWEQSTLRQVLGGDYPWGRSNRAHWEDRALLLDEWQFNVHSPEDQVILHIDHTHKDRVAPLIEVWSWEDYPLSDRPKLAALLDEVDVRFADPSVAAAEMPLR